MPDAPRRVKSNNPPADAGFSEHVIWEKPDGTTLEKKPGTHGWTPTAAAAPSEPAEPRAPKGGSAPVTMQGGRERYGRPGQETFRQQRAEEATSKAEAIEKVAPWKLHDSRSHLSLGDAATVSKMMREEKLSKDDAERKLKWLKDTKQTGNVSAKAATDAMSKR